jgi:hypothetical protein
MTPEALVDQLKLALAGKLRSAVLYGSAAAGDFLPGESNYNLLLVVDRLGLQELNALAKPVTQWTASGHRPPLLFTPGQLERSADVFPIELADIRQSRRVLFGDDPLQGVTIQHEHLRLQLERELREKLLALREGYLRTGGRPKQVLGLLVASLGGFLVLLRAALRLFREDVPAAKLDAMQQLTLHVSFDPLPLLDVHQLKRRTGGRRNIDPQALFASYLNSVEQVVEAVDRHLHSQT